MTDRTSVDRILGVIDAGLQTPIPDPTYGETSPVNDGRCWRCQCEAPADESTAGVCEHCRQDLLDETPRPSPNHRPLQHHWQLALMPLEAEGTIRRQLEADTARVMTEYHNYLMCYRADAGTVHLAAAALREEAP